MINAKTKICMVIGDPINHSLSPLMHNTGYKELKIDDQFIYIACRVNLESIPHIPQAIRGLNIRGVSLTAPHKQQIIKYLDRIDPISEKIGATNTIVNENGILTGYNTDWLGIINPLEKLINLKSKKIAIIGAGGAARAAVFGLHKKGAFVTIFNRTLSSANEIAKDFHCDIKPSDKLNEVKNMDVIFNATSVGMKPNTDESPLPKDYINSSHIIFDAVYAPHTTKLIKDATKKGAKVIHGIEMLLYQGIAQFELFTNKKAPIEKIKLALKEAVNNE